jgi:MFS family permease
LIGSAKVVTAGWALYAVSYLGLALATSVPAALTVIAFYGLYHGFSEGAERALLSDLAPLASRGRAFGLYHSLSGISSLIAGIGFGALWVWESSRAAFLTASGIAGCAAILLVLLLPIAQKARSAENS